MRFLKLILFFLTVLLTPLFAFAQATTTAEQPKSEIGQQIDALVQNRTGLIPTEAEVRENALREYLSVKTIPQNPGPREDIRVTVESYLADLNKATIRWEINGKTIEQGIGKTSFSFKNGASGETTRLTISITTNEGSFVTKELSWSPVGVTILWEADTYTPPFYRGKTLMTPQASVRVIAIPDNTGTSNALNTGNLVYVWEKDGTVATSASGYGKNSFSFVGPKPYGKTNVTVKVSSINDAITSEIRIDLPLAQPFIYFYENHPLLGVWYNRALGKDLTLAKKEFSLSAEPYFFSNERSEASTLVYAWSLNGKSISNTGRAITLRNDKGEKGSSAITLAMHGIKQTFQSASKLLTINFTADESARPAF